MSKLSEIDTDSRESKGSRLGQMRRLRAHVVLATGVASIATVAGLIVVTADASSPSDLQAAKAATARYHSSTQAKKDGYVREGPCVSSPDGAMGIHFVQPQLASDTAVDPEHPEMLLYLPDARGKLRLIGVEYWVPAADQEPPIDNSDTPFVFGRPLDGPMEGHAPGMPYHYDLHVWFWANNPSGLFAQFNPNVSCPN